MATRLVEQWLKIARGEISSQNTNVFNKENLLDSQSQINVKPVQMFSDQSLENASELNAVENSLCVSQINDTDMIDCANEVGEADESEGLVFKITMKDGKQTLAKISETSPKKSSTRPTNDKESESDERSSKMRNDKSKDEKNRLKDGKDREKDKDHHKKSSSSSSSSHKSSSSSKPSSSSSKHSSSRSPSSHTKSHKSSSSTSSSSHKSSSTSSSSRDKDKDKHKSSSSSSKSSSSSSSKDKKSESSKTQAEKDKDTLAKIQPKSLEKVGKIPKKTNPEDASKKPSENGTSVPAKKKSISIEVRKDTENRPKTVKTYNSQFRSHGLAEEAPPPPSRRDLKKPAPIIPTNGIPVIPKRSLSPTNTAKEAAEKRMKLSTSPTIEKPGAIKLIPAKPKRKYLLKCEPTNGNGIVLSPGGVMIMLYVM